MGRVTSLAKNLSQESGDQLPLFDKGTEQRTLKIRSKSRVGAFGDNMAFPVHRWFRYSAGFSAAWAASELGRLPAGATVLDPFAGSGTVLIETDRLKLNGIGLEAHSFIQRVGRTKLHWNEDPESLRQFGLDILAKAKRKKAHPTAPAGLLQKCYTSDQFGQLTQIKDSLIANPADNSKLNDLAWLCLTAVLRKCSGVGTAQWQYVLPSKTKSRVSEPFVAFVEKLDQICSDMRVMQDIGSEQLSSINFADARNHQPMLDGKVDLVITSPPYPNNYDYADSTRLEMMFWNEISGWGDLHKSVRQHLICSCSQHSLADKLDLKELLSRAELRPIHSELKKVCETLADIRKVKGGKKTYHTMVAAYFSDMAHILGNLRRYIKSGGSCKLVVGDSAPYGIYVPVDEWLAKLANSVGFSSTQFEKIRDRNIKWKNRKHRVPLKEGILVIKA